MPTIEFRITGQSAADILAIQQLTGKQEPVDVVIAALRIYEWILAQQTKENTVAAVHVNGTPQILVELVDYVRNKEAARYFFKERPVFAEPPAHST